MDAATKSEASGLQPALRYKFIALAGNEYVRAATAADAAAGAQPKLVIEPGTERELAEILRISNEAWVGKFAGARGCDFINGAHDRNHRARLGGSHRNRRSRLHHSKIAGNARATWPAFGA